MAKIFIKNVLLNNTRTNIRITNNIFSEISQDIKETENEYIINGNNKAILSPFYNGHTHAAMTLLRGYADDYNLFDWLNNYIWPFEAKLTGDDIYIGSKLACLEMIKSGTVFYNDMYWNYKYGWKAAEEMGLRSMIGLFVIDSLSDIETQIKEFSDKYVGSSERVIATIAPHAVYTVNEKLWKRCAEVAKIENIYTHIHLSETEKEVNDCIATHGVSPVKWLDQLGVLNDKCIAAHCVHLSDDDIKILKDRGVIIAHNPVSNMKLSSGFLRTKEIIDSNCKISIGTDGTSSNNNLCMQEEAKIAALIAKCNYTPETLPATLAFDWANGKNANYFGFNGGEIAVGKLADAMLIDLNNINFVPNFNIISNLIYSSSSEAIDTLICDGNILMENRKIDGEEEIIKEVRDCVNRLTK